MKRGGKHGFSLSQRYLSLYWGGSSRHGYDVPLHQVMGCTGDSDIVSTPLGFYHLLRQVGTKEWGLSQDNVHALIRAMAKRFKWDKFETHRLCRHWPFSYVDSNGKTGERHWDDAWVDR